MSHLETLFSPLTPVVSSALRVPTNSALEVLRCVRCAAPYSGGSLAGWAGTRRKKSRTINRPSVCETTAKWVPTFAFSKSKSMPKAPRSQCASLPSRLSLGSGRKGRSPAVRPPLPGCTAGICRAGLGPCRGTRSPAAAHKACPCPAPRSSDAALSSDLPGSCRLELWSRVSAPRPEGDVPLAADSVDSEPFPGVGAPALLESAPENRPPA